MIFRALPALLSFCLLLAPHASAETLRTLRGETIEGRVSGLYGDLLVIGVKNGSFSLNVDMLDEASLRQVALFLASPAATTLAWSQSTSPVAKALAKRLQVLRDGKLTAFDPGARPEPEFYLAYFGAYWCGPCRRFSPRLVEAYHRLKAIAPDRFEVIFISDDQDSAGQLKYAREVNMPWPMLKFSATTAVPAFEKQRARGIPSLVVLTREGDLIFHSYQGEKYLGADDPLERFSDLLSSLTSQTDPVPSPNRHRLAVAQHILAAGNADRELKPYRVAIDHKRLRTVSVPQVEARLKIDARGRVVDAEFPSSLDMISRENLGRDAENWLFLPAVTQGQAHESEIRVPIILSKS